MIELMSQWPSLVQNFGIHRLADEDGVRVEPVFDRTKVALAALTAFGFIFGMMARMRRATRNFD